jgi:predicted N-formylglutamate amidohydrolase
MDATPPNPPAAVPLLGRDDPAPFVVLQEHGKTPALILCDHASRAFPASLDRLGLPELPSWQHIAWDIGAGELARGLAHALDAPAVLAGYSRLVVDCNRSPGDPEAFRSESDGWTIPGNQRLPELERGVRLATFFDPYHECIEAMLGGFRRAGTVPLVIAVHSFAPSLGGQARPWHAGVLWDHDVANARRLLAGLRAQSGLVIGDNEPYSGKHPANYTIDHHAKAHGLPHLCIEVRQDLLGSPAGIERWVRLLARIVREILTDPCSLQPLVKVAPHA